MLTTSSELVVLISLVHKMYSNNLLLELVILRCYVSRHVDVHSLSMTKREIFTWHYLILALNDLYSVEILWNKFLEKSAYLSQVQLS
jgi:fumarate reductase subunit D